MIRIVISGKATAQTHASYAASFAIRERFVAIHRKRL
jgi:hypothetical protein